MTSIDIQLNISLKQTPDVAPAIKAANNGIGVGDERWRTLWHEPMQGKHIESVLALTNKLKTSCVNFLLLGIGGSALGAKALHASLGEDSPNFFILDNIDPHTVARTLESIKEHDPTFEHTVVAVVSKSGETAEITSLLMVTERAMPNATYVAITGATGTLHDYATAKQWAILPVPDGVGGRFSVLSPVGLFPAAMCGIDIEALLAGARSMDDRCKKFEHNPAAHLAGGLVGAMREGKASHVMMPYCDRLVQFAHWYVQLWAESLGKINNDGVRVGPTPIAAVGATDQHSMVQLWREGPTDKVIGFVNVAEVESVPLGDTSISTSQDWLCGETLGSLLHAQQQATEHAMQEAGQATWTITLARLDAFALGEFIALWQAAVAIAGRLLDVNPYNQPGVELGKKLTRDAISKK